MISKSESASESLSSIYMYDHVLHQEMVTCYLKKHKMQVFKYPFYLSLVTTCQQNVYTYFIILRFILCFIHINNTVILNIISYFNAVSSSVQCPTQELMEFYHMASQTFAHVLLSTCWIL